MRLVAATTASVSSQTLPMAMPSLGPLDEIAAGRKKASTRRRRVHELSTWQESLSRAVVRVRVCRPVRNWQHGRSACVVGGRSWPSACCSTRLLPSRTRTRRIALPRAALVVKGLPQLQRYRTRIRSWRRGGRAPTVRRRSRRTKKGDDREAYRRAEANRDLEAERASALEWADVARARADAEEARLRAARREADAVEARLRELERRRHALARPSPPTTPRRDAPARSPLVTRPEPSPEKPAEDDSFPSFHKEPTPREPTPREPTPRVDAPSEQSLPQVEPTPEPTPRQWPPFGQTLIGAHVKIHVEGVWLRGEITDVAAAMPELDGGNGVCIHIPHAGEDEWHEYGSDEVVIMDEDIYVHPRPPFNEDLVGNFVQVHVAGAWLNAVITEVDADHNGHQEICIQYATIPSADKEWHLYDSEDIIYRDDPTTPGASHMSRATPENVSDSPRVIDATPQRVPASATPKVISEWKKTDRAWPPFSEQLVGSEVKVLVDGASLAAEIIEVAEAMAELDGLNGVCIRFRDDEHADEEWHEYGTEDILFVREEPVASPGSFFR